MIRKYTQILDILCFIFVYYFFKNILLNMFVSLSIDSLFIDRLVNKFITLLDLAFVNKDIKFEKTLQSRY